MAALILERQIEPGKNRPHQPAPAAQATPRKRLRISSRNHPIREKSAWLREDASHEHRELAQPRKHQTHKRDLIPKTYLAGNGQEKAGATESESVATLHRIEDNQHLGKNWPKKGLYAEDCAGTNLAKSPEAEACKRCTA